MVLKCRSQSPGMPGYMYSYIKQGRSVSSLRCRLFVVLIFISITIIMSMAGGRSSLMIVRRLTHRCTSTSPPTSPERFRSVFSSHLLSMMKRAVTKMMKTMMIDIYNWDDGQVSGVSSRSLSRTGMRTRVDNLQAESPRPRSWIINVITLNVHHYDIEC